MTSSGWTRQRRCEYRQTTVQEPWGATVRRYVLIFATAFGGAWTAIVGGLALAGNSAGVAAASGDLQRLPPVGDPRANIEFVLGWAVLGALAMLVQLRDVGRRRLRKQQIEAQLARR